jgi:hypothetical protein
MAATGMTRKELLALPVTVDLRTAAKALSIGYGLAQRIAQADEFPCQVQRLGRQYRVVTQGPNGLLAACGITDQPTGKGAADAA